MKVNFLSSVRYAQTVFLILLFLFLPLIFSRAFMVSFEFPKQMFFRIIVIFLFMLVGYEFVFNKGLFRKYLFYIKENKYLFLPLFFLIYALFRTCFSNFFYLSFFGSENRIYGFISLFYSVIFFYLLVFLLRRSINIRSSLISSAISSIFVIIIGLLQMYGYIPWLVPRLSFESLRMFSTIGQPNILAAFLIIIYPTLLLLIKRNKYNLIFMSLFFLLAIYFTGSRIALAISLFEVLSVVFFFFKKRLERIIISISITSLMMFSIWFFHLLSYRIFSIDTLRSRFLLWKSGLLSFIDNPLWGYGYDSFITVSHKYINPEIGVIEYAKKMPDRAHNIILDKLIENGLIGFIIGLFFISIILYKLFQNKTIQAKLLFISILGFILMMFFNFQTVITNVYICLVLAISINVVSKFDISKENFYMNLNIRKGIYIFIILILSFFGIFIVYDSVLASYNLKKYSIINNIELWDEQISWGYISPSKILHQIDNDVGRVNKGQKDYDLIIHSLDYKLDKYLSLTGDYKTYYIKKGYYYRKILSFQDKPLGDAIYFFQQAALYQPWNPEIYGELAITAMMADNSDIKEFAADKFYEYLPADKRIDEMEDYKLKRMKQVIDAMGS